MRFLIVFFSLFFSSGVFSNETHAPLTVVTLENVEISPVLYEKVLLAYDEIGYTLNLIKMPSKRAFVEAQKNDEIDADLVRAIEAEKLLTNYIRIPVPITYAEIKAYMNKEHSDVNSWDSLVDYKTVSVRGILATSIKLNQHKIPFTRVSTPQQALSMVSANRVDAAIIIAQLIENKDNITTISSEFPYTKVIEKKPFFHFIHKRHEALVPALTEAFKRIFPS